METHPNHRWRKSNDFIDEVWNRAKWQKSVDHLVAKIMLADDDTELLGYARQLKMVGRFKDGEWDVKVR